MASVPKAPLADPTVPLEDGGRKKSKALSSAGNELEADQCGTPLVMILSEEDKPDPSTIVRRVDFRPPEADVDTRPRPYVDRFFSPAERDRVMARAAVARHTAEAGPPSPMWTRLALAVWRRIAVSWLLPDDLLALRLVSREVAAVVGDNAAVWAMMCLRDLPRRTDNLLHLSEYTEGVSRLISTVARVCAVPSSGRYTGPMLLGPITVQNLASVIPTPDAARWASARIPDRTFCGTTAARLARCAADSGRGLHVPNDCLRTDVEVHFDSSGCAVQKVKAPSPTHVALDVGREPTDSEAAAFAAFGPREFYLKWRGPLLRQFLSCNKPEITQMTAREKSGTLTRVDTARQLVALLCYRNGVGKHSTTPDEFLFAVYFGRGLSVTSGEEQSIKTVEAARWLALCPLCRSDADVLHRFAFGHIAEATEALCCINNGSTAAAVLLGTFVLAVPFVKTACEFASDVVAAVAGGGFVPLSDLSLSHLPSRSSNDGVISLFRALLLARSTSPLVPWLPTVALAATASAVVGSCATRWVEHPTTRLARRSSSFAVLRWGMRTTCYLACSATEALLHASFADLQHSRVPIACLTFLPTVVAGGVAFKAACGHDKAVAAVSGAVAVVFGGITAHPSAFAAAARREVLPGVTAGAVVIQAAFIGLRAAVRYGHRITWCDNAAAMISNGGETRRKDARIPEPYTCDEEPSPPNIEEFEARFSVRTAVAEAAAKAAAPVGIVDELIAGTVERAMVFSGVAWSVAWACRAAVTAATTAAELATARTAPREVWL